ncbi:maltose operon protein MalM [Zobellella denitrificans]|uniref:MalM family protein n=1 Tax=Zobellella denitrificans TaxID=347534 RepID=UPI000B8C0EA7|nr:MalM family protein [Zobellella denitrificans]OXS14808.1 maltose operon protein MalM [Zobellella denitrificans]
MNKTLVALCLFGAVLAARPVAAAEAPQDLPTIGQQQLAALQWQPLNPPVTETLVLDDAGPRLDTGLGEGPVAAFTLPADRGTLELTLHSLVNEHNQVFAPNVLVLDEQLRPAAFYPADAFPFASGRLLLDNRLAGSIRLTPMPGQQRIHILVFTRSEDLARHTMMPHPAKVHAQAIGNQPPAIPDVRVSHQPQGKLQLKVAAEQKQGAVVIGPQPLAATAASPAAAPQPETEAYFTQAIRAAAGQGDIDKALRLMEEAERLGIDAARRTFVEAVK